MVDRRTETPLKMSRAKRTTHLWAVMFHTLEAIDVVTVRKLDELQRHQSPPP